MSPKRAEMVATAVAEMAKLRHAESGIRWLGMSDEDVNWVRNTLIAAAMLESGALQQTRT